MDINYSSMFLWALIFTCFIETLILFILMRFIFKINKNRIQNPLLILSGIFASFATLPYVWFIFPAFISNRFAFITISELFVFTIEAIFYFFMLRISFKKALSLSFVCNLFSFGLGLLIF